MTSPYRTPPPADPRPAWWRKTWPQPMQGIAIALAILSATALLIKCMHDDVSERDARWNAWAQACSESKQCADWYRQCYATLESEYRCYTRGVHLWGSRP